MKRFNQLDFVYLDKPDKFYLFSLVTYTYTVLGVDSKFCTTDITIWNIGGGNCLSTANGIFYKILPYSVISRYGRFW